MKARLLLVRIAHFVWMNLELFFWVGALALLFLIEPDHVHFTLCPISNLGFDFCPGCGLGHSIHEAMWFDFMASLKTHPLGIVAILIIGRRIITLFNHNIIKSNKNGVKSVTTYSGY